MEKKVSAYLRLFEQVITLVLGIVVACVTIISLLRVVYNVSSVVWTSNISELGFAAFKDIFAMVMVVLIAMEFFSSVMRYFTSPNILQQVKSIILIVLLTITRKLIILDYSATSWLTMVGLSAVICSLGFIFWILNKKVAGEAAGH